MIETLLLITGFIFIRYVLFILNKHIIKGERWLSGVAIFVGIIPVGIVLGLLKQEIITNTIPNVLITILFIAYMVRVVSKITSKQ